MRIAIAFFALIFTVQVQATEIDDTTSFYDAIPDSEAVLNTKTQELIDSALATFRGCDQKAFARLASYKLTGNLFYGAIEAQANNSTEVSKVSLKVSESIFKDSPYESSIVGRLFGLGSTINIDGTHIGTDKLGHFFDMGYELWQMTEGGSNLMDIVDKATREQQGIWGYWTTGIKSYGDITANFDGYRFWRDFAGEGSQPFFTCEQNYLKQVRAFKWSDYVSAAWTEAINCSEYWSPNYDFYVAMNVHDLEVNNKRRYQCPIKPETCDDLRVKYSQWLGPLELPKVISPGCRLKPTGS
jgi:hypothetical protein